MDEMKVKLSTKFMRNIVSKLMSRAIYKKTGYKVDIQLDDLDIWSINGDTTIILNEIDTNYIVTTIMKDSYIATFKFDNVNATELNHNDTIDEGTIKITKTDNGINVEAQSKRDGDIFNEITGTYKKS